MDMFSSAINPGLREAPHTAQRKAAKQHRSGIVLGPFIRAFSLPNRNVGSVHQGYDWKTIGMALKYYGDTRLTSRRPRCRRTTGPRPARRTASSSISSTCGTGLMAPCWHFSVALAQRQAVPSGALRAIVLEGA